MKRLLLQLIPTLVIATNVLSRLVHADLECEIGWGKLGTHKIPVEMIDDGYCDCPLDCADEPHTNACSGSTVGGITGIVAVSTESKKYQCPKQRKRQIPYSRFRDGICDCCDGSDELPAVCPDICDQVLEEERALRKKLAVEFSFGQKQREKEILEFQELLKEKEIEKAGVDENLELAEERLTEAEMELNRVMHEYMLQRVHRVREIARRVANAPAEGETANDSLTSLLEPLPNHEIIDLIVHSCQMAGEMDRAANLDDSTCVPLRLAGLDAAIMWGRENEGKADLKRLHVNVREEGKLLAEMLIHNAKEDDEHNKHFLEEKEKGKHRRRSKPSRPGRRRLMEVITDDAVLNDDFYDSLRDENDPNENGPYPDDYIPEEEGGDDNEDEGTKERRDGGIEGNDGEEVDDEKIILDELKASLFSQPRVAFLQRSSEVISGVDELLKEKKEEEGEEVEKGDKRRDIDPAPYNTVKSTLKGRIQSIQRGFDYAVSAKILLNALADSTDDHQLLRGDLQTLAIGTLVYGKLSTVHVWQLLQAILKELNPKWEDAGKETKTCATSPWVAACPPRAIIFDSVPFPPRQVLDAAQALCTTPTFTKEKAQACAADADNKLPTVVPDGYYGYDVVKPREDHDALATLAAEWDPPIEETVHNKLDELEAKKEKLEGEQRDIKKSMDDISNLVQGAKESRFGSDGELYSLKDECFSVKAGKYTYELCVFGSAAQKEGDAKSGTNLGQWENVEYDSQTGIRVFKWTNGVKCWNGPKRSATAFVTCGAETKVLSAEEPDTCRYVMQMESHIACDDAFRVLHEL